MVNVQDKQFGRMGNRFFQLAYLWAQFREGKIPDIYLQDYKLFDKYKDEIREMFKQEGEPLDYVSVHVRRGKNPSIPAEPNYSENPFYLDLTKTDYYTLARAIFSYQQAKFLFFSDDLEWCKKHYLFPNCSFHEGTELEDFNAMARCKGHIIANSSFSWWAAYLGGGQTMAPKNWFSNGTRINYPSDWMVL